MLLHHIQQLVPDRHAATANSSCSAAAAASSAASTGSGSRDDCGPLAMSAVARSFLEACAAGTRQPKTAAEALAAFGLISACSDVRLPLEIQRPAINAAMPIAAAAQQQNMPTLQSGSGNGGTLNPVRFANCFFVALATCGDVS